MTKPLFSAFPGLLLPIAATALVVSCAGEGGGGPISCTFVVGPTNPYGVAASTKIAVSGGNLAFLAAESLTGPIGMNLNGDADAIPSDQVAIVVHMGNHAQTVLRAAQDLAWIGSHLYLVVSEAEDGRQWNTDPGDQVVLLHWTHGQVGDPDFIDTLSTAWTRKMIAVGGLLFYSAETTPAGPMMSNLRVIASADPLATAAVATTDATAELSPRILGEDEGLIFLSLDEAAESRDLNGDADPVPDDLVLALLDGTGAIAAGVYDQDARNTRLAIPSKLSPFRARKSAVHDWQVGFLVSESAQDDTNFNVVNTAPPVELDIGWEAIQCDGSEDTDSSDDVLFFLDWSDWITALDSPRNTGLVGRGGSDGEGQIAIAGGFIAVISDEQDAGPCDLNFDGDLAILGDRVVRMTKIVARPAPIIPINDHTRILALFDLDGGTHGLAELQGRLVICVSESAENQDLNLFGQNDNLIGWLIPADSPAAWDFTHGSGNLTFVGASWMVEQEDRGRLYVAYEEKVRSPGADGQPNTADDLGGVSLTGDTDLFDSIPTAADFVGAPSYLRFLGVTIAVDDDEAGIIAAGDCLFYRADENEDNRDWNGDGDDDDFVLRRVSFATGAPATVATLSSLPGRPAIEFHPDEAPFGAAFITDESRDGPSTGPGTDLNGDGRIGLIVRYGTF